MFFLSFTAQYSPFLLVLTVGQLAVKSWEIRTWSISIMGYYFNHLRYLIQTRSQMRAMESMASPKIILLYLSKF